MESLNLKGESSHCIKATSVAAKQIRKLAQHQTFLYREPPSVESPILYSESCSVVPNLAARSSRPKSTQTPVRIREMERVQ